MIIILAYGHVPSFGSHPVDEPAHQAVVTPRTTSSCARSKPACRLRTHSRAILSAGAISKGTTHRLRSIHPGAANRYRGSWARTERCCRGLCAVCSRCRTGKSSNAATKMTTMDGRVFIIIWLMTIGNAQYLHEVADR